MLDVDGVAGFVIGLVEDPAERNRQAREPVARMVACGVFSKQALEHELVPCLRVGRAGLPPCFEQGCGGGRVVDQQGAAEQMAFGFVVRRDVAI